MVSKYTPRSLTPRLQHILSLGSNVQHLVWLSDPLKIFESQQHLLEDKVYRKISNLNNILFNLNELQAWSMHFSWTVESRIYISLYHSYWRLKKIGKMTNNSRVHFFIEFWSEGGQMSLISWLIYRLMTWCIPKNGIQRLLIRNHFTLPFSPFLPVKTHIFTKN